MEFSTEPIPTWALCYLINDDRSGLTDEEIAMIDKWYTDNKVMSVTTALRKMASATLTSHAIRLSVYQQM